MCGIIGYVGNKGVCDQIKNGLMSVEYRGYDSAGISYFEGNSLITQKRVGNVKNLFDSIEIPDSSTCGIGHTRWATHGEVSERNAHPHISFDGKFTLVHNGIIENYASLKNGILKGVRFRTQTDSEVIVNLVAFYYAKGQRSVLECVKECVKQITGSYAFALLCADEPNMIYIGRDRSPLIVGQGESESFLASDIVGLGSTCKEYAQVPDQTIGRVCADKIECYDANGKHVWLDFKPVVDCGLSADLGANAHFMQKEINEVPAVIVRTAQLYISDKNPINLITSSFWDDIDRVEFVACGTSYHASMVGAMFIEDNAKIVSRTNVASEFVYNPPLLNAKTLCVFVSQSGETADTLHAVSVAKEHGAKTLGITNVMTSNIATQCDAVLPLVAGAEVAVASTKAYNAQVTVMMLLAEFLRHRRYKKIASEIISTALTNLDMSSMWADAQKFADAIGDAKSVYFVGRHMDYITCLESSLKLKEVSYIQCEAYAAGELKHGTIALVEPGTLMIAIVTEPKLLNKTQNIVAQAEARGAKVLYVSSVSGKELGVAEDSILTLPHCPLELSPLFSIIPMQMVAYLVSTARGYNPDRPRNLAKSVTVE